MTSLEEYGTQAAILDRLTRIERAHAKAKAELAIARTQIKELDEERIAAEYRLDTYEQLGGECPGWLTPSKPKNTAATIITMLSDLHLDEIVNPEEIGWANAYNRKIAEQRLKKWTSKVIELSTSYVAGVNIEGIVVALGGDLISGDIHEELKETNETTTMDSVVYWSEILASSITTIADHFGKVFVPCVVGNHGRTTRKPRMKLRVKTNFDWLLCTMVANHLKADKRITFSIPESADCIFDVYETKVLMTHGDSVKAGSSGVGGLFPPLFRYKAKKQTNDSFDLLMVGHFHTLVLAASQGFICNGSLKGPDEFSRINCYADEPPQQAFLVCTPKNGVTIQAPVFCQDNKEKW